MPSDEELEEPEIYVDWERFTPPSIDTSIQINEFLDILRLEIIKACMIKENKKDSTE